MDPLSEVLEVLKPRSYLSAGLAAGGAWALSFPAPDGVKFNAAMKGSCWVSVEGDSEPRRIEEGDCFLLTRGRAFTLSSDPNLPAVDSSPLYRIAGDGVATCNGGGDFFLVGARFAFTADVARLLFASLPPAVTVASSSDQASVLRWTLERFAAELRENRAGSRLVAEHLAHLMLVQILRLYLEDREGAGWLYALFDPQLGRALSAIHSRPGRQWNLAELAEAAGMSRSLFAEKFKGKVGMAPIEYLTRWRMLAAEDRLRNSEDTVAAIAYSLGYGSESAFSAAFKRINERSPRQYKSDHVG